MKTELLHNLGTLVEKGNLYVCQIGIDRTVQYLSDSWHFLIGKTGDSLVGKPFSQLLHPDYIDEFDRQLDPTRLSSDRTLEFECAINIKTRIYTLKFTGYFEPKDKRSAFVFFVQDISEQKRLEADHQRMTVLLRDTENEARVGHWQINVKTQHLYWSDEIYRIHGVSKDEYYPELTTAIKFYHADDIDQVQTVVNKAIDTGEDWVFTHRLIRPTGEIRHVLVRGSVIKDESGKSEKIVGICSDITHTYEIRRELDMLSNVTKYSNTGTVITDTCRRVTWINEAFSELTGYSLEDLKGHNLSILQGKKTDPSTIIELSEALASGESINRDILNYRKDGSTYWNRLLISPIYVDDKLSFFVGYQRDVTDEFEAKAALKKMNQELEKLVDEKTKTLTDTIASMEKLVAENKYLREVIPICSYCKSIRDENGNWRQLEEYFSEYADARFSHAICPKCSGKIINELDEPSD